MEYLGKMVDLHLDRPKGSMHPEYGFRYLVNYGFVPRTLAPDGDCLDAYYLADPFKEYSASGRCVAIVHRLTDDDDKLIVAPPQKAITRRQIIESVSFQETRGQYILVWPWPRIASFLIERRGAVRTRSSS